MVYRKLNAFTYISSSDLLCTQAKPELRLLPSLAEYPVYDNYL